MRNKWKGRGRQLVILSLQGLVLGYRILISPILLPRCRFSPSCSLYCYEAIKTYGCWQGLILTLKRLGQCHPWGGSGYDPIP